MTNYYKKNELGQYLAEVRKIYLEGLRKETAVVMYNVVSAQQNII